MKLVQLALLVGIASAIPNPSTLFRRSISDVPSGGVDCGGQKFNQTVIETAAQRGVYDTEIGPHPEGYPHHFYNSEHLVFPNCANGTLIEFPILRQGSPYGGGKANRYRVVYETTSHDDGKYCGVMYHQTANATSYTKCAEVEQ